MTSREASPSASATRTSASSAPTTSSARRRRPNLAGGRVDAPTCAPATRRRAGRSTCPAESVDFMFSDRPDGARRRARSSASRPSHRALRPGGVYFYIQAPFWSCAQGHHFRHSDDATYDFIPKFSHLTHDRDGLRGDAPRPARSRPFDIDACVDSVFDRPDLSRLGLRQTRAIVERGPLQLVRLDRRRPIAATTRRRRGRRSRACAYPFRVRGAGSLRRRGRAAQAVQHRQRLTGGSAAQPGDCVATA